jgi:hypothetical protein
MFQRTVSFWRRLLGAAPQLDDTATQVAEERRQSARYRIDQTVRYAPASPDAQALGSGTATVRNISAGGISLIMDREFSPGQLLSIELPDNGSEATSVLACVVYVNAEADGRWAVGCTFASDLGPADLQTFSSGGSAPDEQRSQPRHECAIEATYSPIGEECDEPLPARVLNISTAGVGLAVSHSIQVGKLLNVELRSTGQDNFRNLLCCAVHVTELGSGEWLVGCNFITELEESALKSLLRS